MSTIQLNELIYRLKAAKEDPMWANHVELNKKTVANVIEQLEAMPLLLQKTEAWRQWQDKTDWMLQDKSWPVGSLGKHRADVLREEIERLREVERVLVEIIKVADSEPECCTEAMWKNIIDAKGITNKGN